MGGEPQRNSGWEMRSAVRTRLLRASREILRFYCLSRHEREMLLTSSAQKETFTIVKNYTGADFLLKCCRNLRLHLG